MKLHFNKKIFTATVLVLLLYTSAVGMSANAVEIPDNVDPTKVINFLKDIFQIDTDKYDTILLKSSTRPWNDVAQTVGQYGLMYSDYDNGADSSALTVTFNFWNSELIDCSLQRTNYDDGIIHYTQKPENDLRKHITGVLQRYQTHTKDEQITQMINLLKTADLKDGYTNANDNLQLTIQVVNKNTYLTWSNTVNGVSYSRLNLRFTNGELTGFRDDRAFYSLGSDVVKISEEQAISVALEQAASLSYTYDDEVITGFDIVKEQILVQASAMARSSESLLVRYPIWIVDLPLSDVYPGMVSFIRVMLWADTGEVISVQPLGAGFPNDYDNLTQISSSFQDGESSSGNSTPLVVYFVGACLVIIISIALIVIVLKRRNK
ncbi:MAG: hypothetical protein FWH37_09495 [Candidatus Bathyarchaeota archaeon]|nr:hypothetical protein [Candidatus Termiticorpusculum sp.]